MSDPTPLEDVVAEALRNYHDLNSLQTSKLGEFQSVWPLPTGAWGEMMAAQARGLAVHRLLDRAIAELAESLPESADLLHQRFRRQRSIKDLSKSLNVAAATLFIHQARAITALTGVIANMEAGASESSREKLYRQTAALPSLFQGDLVGFEGYLGQMRNALRAGLAQPGSLVVVTGLGGIGKTSLTCAALRSWLTQEAPPVERILWASVEQTNPLLSGETAHKTQILERLLWQLGEQLDVPIAAIPSVAKQVDAIAGRLLRAPHRYVIVLDNVETQEEVEFALKVATPLLTLAQVIITSRLEIPHNRFSLVRLQELPQAYALELLHREARQHGMILASDDAQRLFEKIGGHPLALKLIIGQVSCLPIEQVVDALDRHSLFANALFTHVYESSWQLLSDLSREVLLGLTLLPPLGATWQGLTLVLPPCEDAVLEQAITELRKLNLLQVAPSSKGGYIYSLHRLTYHFLERKSGLSDFEVANE